VCCFRLVSSTICHLLILPSPSLLSSFASPSLLTLPSSLLLSIVFGTLAALTALIAFTSRSSNIFLELHSTFTIKMRDTPSSSRSSSGKVQTINSFGMGRLHHKNAIVTGAAGGIGLETCILFAKEGANVLMADISAAALEMASAKLKQLVPSAHRVEVQVCDVSKEADIKILVERLDSWGGVDIMFNNAGIMHADDADAIDTPEKIWDLTQAINVKGVWFGCKHSVLSMRKHNKTKGSIINTASVVALVGSATPQLAYTASKGAVLALTRELAIVHAREGFRFNALCPAPLNTPLLQDWLGDDQPKRHRREIHFPTGRFGEAIEQAQAVLFLASDEASFVNGQDFVVDGGLTKAYVTPEGPPLAAPKNNALLSEQVDAIRGTGVPHE